VSGRGARGLLPLVVVIAALAPSVAPAAADSHQLAVGTGTAQVASARSVTGACEIRMGGWVQELGASGVKRFKAQFWIASPNASALSYNRSGWGYSVPFPDDARSFYEYFHWTIRTRPGSTYGLWMKGVGERPSFWQPDLVKKVKVGETGCDSLGGIMGEG
jgi:hypothetical protein